MSELTDVELVQKTLKNPDEYAGIIERYEESIIRYIHRITGGSHEEVEELAQVIFIKAYRSLNGFDQGLKFSSWLYRIAHNVSVDFLRKNSKRDHISLDADDEEHQALIEKISSDEDIHWSFTKESERQAVRTIIAQLPEKYRDILILFYLEEKSYEEISDILQMPVNTVGTLVHRAKKHFLALAREPQFHLLFSYGTQR